MRGFILCAPRFSRGVFWGLLGIVGGLQLCGDLIHLPRQGRERVYFLAMGD